MPETPRSPRNVALRKFITEKRKKAELRQVDVAKRLGRHQSYIANIETGQRRLDVADLLDLAQAIGFDPRQALKAAMKKSSSGG